MVFEKKTNFFSLRLQIIARPRKAGCREEQGAWLFLCNTNSCIGVESFLIKTQDVPRRTAAAIHNA